MGDVIGMGVDERLRRRRLLAEALVLSRAAEKEIIIHDLREDDQRAERLAERIGVSVGAR